MESSRPTEYIVIVTEQGKIIKFESTDLRPQIRGGKGVRGIVLENGDAVVSAFVVEDDKKINESDEV